MSELPSVNPWLDPSQKPYIQIENVTKKFGDFHSHRQSEFRYLQE